MVYAYNEFPTALFCHMIGYEPNEGQHWSIAWKELGICVGTIAPTDAPINVVLSDTEGCPDIYEAGADYDHEDKVTKDKLVYECK